MAVVNMQEVMELYRRASHRPYETYQGPIRIAPHCWFVGDAWVGVILIETKEGIAMIDSGIAGQFWMIMEAVRKLGYDPEKDIKLCMLSHAHLDHCSNMATLQHYCHPVMYMSPYEKEWVEHPEIYFSRYDDTVDQYIPFEMDRFYDYKTPIRLGEFTFEVMHTPGHTPGTSSFFFDDTDEETGKTYRVGLHGGLGLNTMLDGCYENPEDAFRDRDAFRRQLNELLQLKVDISAVNHPLNIDMASMIPEDKNDYTNFVNREVWRKQMLDKLAELDELEQISKFQREKK